MMASKILSWNINGLRSQKTDMKDFLDNLSASVICFQETKVTRDMLEEAHAIIEGYSSYFSFSKKRSGYSGVATYCKNSATPVSAQDGLSGRDGNCVPGGSYEYLAEGWDHESLKSLDYEGRSIITVHKVKVKSVAEFKLSIINVYCPRADPEKPERENFKLQFYQLLRQRAESLRKAGSHVIIVGDVNTSHRAIDHCDPYDIENFGCRPDRLFLSDFLLAVNKAETPPSDTSHSSHVNIALKSELSDGDIDFSCDFKMIDTFRHFHPHQKDAFTCWNTKANARATNYGTRIDYTLCDAQFICYVNDSQIHPDIEGSDHCPVSLQLVSDAAFEPSEKCPPVCTKYFPEFKGSQQKLQTYFKPVEKQPEIANCDTKRKCNSLNSACKQKKLSSFFNVVPKSINSAESNSSQVKDVLIESKSALSNGSNSILHNKPAQSKPEAGNWAFLFKRPKSPPLCSGHKEPSVLRTVKKKGPNFNRQFFACNRGAGRTNDPNAQCSFFEWR